MTPSGNLRRETEGVTLLELLVVVALASILLAVVFPSVGSGLTTLELRTSAQRLAAAARYARDQAVYRKTAFHLEIDSEAGRVAVMDLQGRARRAFNLPASVRVESILPPQEEASSRVRRFLFMPDGAAPAFEVVLANQRREMRVVNDPLTGAAKVPEGNGE
jgi:general secretion pathway protein H